MGGFRKMQVLFNVGRFKEGEFKTVKMILVTWSDGLSTRVAICEMHIDAWRDRV